MFWRILIAALVMIAVFGIAIIAGVELSGRIIDEAARTTPEGVLFNTDLFITNQIFAIVQGWFVLCALPFVFWLRAKTVLSGERNLRPNFIIGLVLFIVSAFPAFWNFAYNWPKIILALLATIVSLAAIHFILPHRPR